MVRLRSFIPRPRFATVLTALLLILVLSPVVEQQVRPALSRMLGLLGLFIPVFAVAVAGDTPRARWIAAGLAILCLLTSAEGMTGLLRLPAAAPVSTALVFLAYTTSRLMLGVVRSRTVTPDVIAGALASYMLVGLTWAIGYGFLEALRPGSIHGLTQGGDSLGFSTLLYFSFITLLTIGYGDIAPVSATARMMAVLEGLLGMAFTTIILAVLVAAHLRQRGEADPGSE